MSETTTRGDALVVPFDRAAREHDRASTRGNGQSDQSPGRAEVPDVLGDVTDDSAAGTAGDFVQPGRRPSAPGGSPTVARTQADRGERHRGSRIKISACTPRAPTDG